MKYRKKPVVIDAIPVNQILTNSHENLPDWVREGILADKIILDEGHIHIQTLEGRMTAQSGDWIIRGVKGEIYPCKPDIFAHTYEPVEG